jgi:flagellar export protein FliJ
MAPKFSLQNVLDLRHSHVDALEVELSQLMQARLNAQGILDAFLILQIDLMQKLTLEQADVMDLFSVSILRSNILTVDYQIVSMKEKLRAATLEVEAKRQELIQARQKKETLETLKNKRIEVYQTEVARYEARTQDDIYISQAFQQRSAEAHIP